MIRRPPRSRRVRSSSASDVYKRQVYYVSEEPTDTTHPIWINPNNDANGEIIDLAKETAELTARETLSSWVETEVEEGTWTAEVWVNNPNNGESVLSKPEYSTNDGWIVGYFKRVGNLIYITCDINIDIESLPANSTKNYVRIFGLPFTSNNVPTGNNVLRKARGSAAHRTDL